MKIVHSIDRLRLELGGVVRAVLDMAGVLAQHGCDVTLLTFDATDAPPDWLNPPEAGRPTCRQLPVPAGPLGRFSRAQLRDIEPHLRQADALHLHTPWVPSNLQLAAIARRLGIPYVLTIHGMLDDWSMAQKTLKKRAYLALGARAMLERAAFVHCTASAERDQAIRWMPRARTRVVPLVFDLEPFRTLPGPGLARQAYPALDSGDPTILFLSRLHPKKRPDLVLEAAALLRDRGRPVQAFLVGTGEPDYEQHLRQRAAQLGLGDRALFPGLVTGQTKVSLYEAADVFVLPTQQENFGFVLPEALACRTPVVTTRGTDIWADLESSGGAVIVDPVTPAALADAIADLLADPDRRRQMGERGRQWVLDTLDPDAVAGRLLDLYASARART